VRAATAVRGGAPIFASAAVRSGIVDVVGHAAVIGAAAAAVAALCFAIHRSLSGYPEIYECDYLLSATLHQTISANR
jgi:hypothetical protein